MSRQIGERPMTGAERARKFRQTRRLQREAERATSEIPVPAPRAVPAGRLQNLEYDVELRQAFYVPRADLAPTLHRLAEAVIAGLQAFAGRHIAAQLGRPHAAVTPLLRAEITAHLGELGDLHGEVEKALDGAAGRWQRFPPERGRDGPALPEFVPPANFAEAHARQAAAQARLEEIKLKVRAGILLANWPARKATADLLIGWRQQCLDWFAVRACPTVLAGLDLEPTVERQWAFFAAVQRAMHQVLARVAAAEASEFAQYIAPPDELSVADWADAHRVLTSRGSAEPGPYRTARTPYLRALMTDLGPTSPVQKIVFKKAAQVGASEAGNCWLGEIVDQAPGPVMIVQPTVELAKRYSKQRIDPLFEESDRLRSNIRPARSRDSGNTVLMKEFLGGVLVITGANSAVGLRSMPVRYLFLDEVDAYAPDVGDEGDPVSLARARMFTFSFRAKELMASSPKLKGMSRISREYGASDRQRYFVPCPLCGFAQVLNFDRMRWQPGRPDTVQYQCAHCEGTFAEHHKTAMLARGEWRTTRLETEGPAEPGVRGYHISGLYSPLGWLSWADIARQWEAAIGDADARKTFVNTVLGEDWEEEAAEVPDWQRLYDRREAWPFALVPERGLFLTAGLDVQIDRIEIDVWAWGRGLESWLVDHIIIAGDPGRPDIWGFVDELLSRTWEHQSGARLALQRLAIDTGFSTQMVYQWARGQDRAMVLPVRGIGTYDRLVPVSGPTKVDVSTGRKKIKGGLNLWTVSVSFFKREFYKLLTLDRPTDEELEAGFTYPAGFVHLPDTVSDEWVKQLVAEQPVIVRSRRGFQARTEWRQLRPRNEALDCRNYARAAAWLAGADRWSEARWRMLEGQLGLEPPPAKPVPPPEPSPAAEGEIIPPRIAGNIRTRTVRGTRTVQASQVRRRRIGYYPGG